MNIVRNVEQTSEGSGLYYMKNNHYIYETVAVE